MKHFPADPPHPTPGRPGDAYQPRPNGSVKPPEPPRGGSGVHLPQSVAPATSQDLNFLLTTIGELASIEDALTGSLEHADKLVVESARNRIRTVKESLLGRVPR